MEETTIKCPICGAPTWIQLADGFQTIFCYSAACHWKQQIGKDVETTKIRDEIMIFAQRMEMQMRENEKKGKGDSWMYATPVYMLDRLTGEDIGEIWELGEAVFSGENGPDEKNLRHEAMDVATIAFFIWYGSLLRSAGGIGP